MSKTKLKLILWLILGVTAVFLVLGLISRVAGLLAYFQEGADPASALNIVPNVPPELQVRLDWLPDDADTGRRLEPLTRTLIESAYLRAWLQWNISYLRGEPYGLETYFVGPALEAVTESIQTTHEQGWSMAQTDLEHQLQLHFYAADGSIASFTAHDVLVAQVLRDQAATPILVETSRADYDVVMMLEDGNWRVRHWVRTEAEILEADAATADLLPDFVTVADEELMLGERPYPVRGLNYYPQQTPWHDFWPEYDAAVIDQDFAIIEELGLNTIRIFVPYQPQLPEPEDEEAEPVDPYVDLRQKLGDLLDKAEAHNLKVIVTLFDFRTDYQILLWPNADRDLEEIVPFFAEHPAILAWDLKNEPDWDQPGNTPEMVNGWLAHVAWQVRRHDPNHLLTIGWATIEAAPQLADVVDFVSFHYYGPAPELADKVGQLRTAVPEKPILLTEFGLPTWNSPFFPHGHTKQEQATYYADIRRALAQTDSAGYLAWTLYDFPSVPAAAVGLMPWRTGPQRYLGLIDRDGELKPAAFLLAEDADLEVGRPFFLARFLKPFWLMLLTTVTLSGLGVVWYVRRRRASHIKA